MRPPAERRAALRTRFPTWEPAALATRVDAAAAEFGDRPLVVTDERTLTYDDVVAESVRLADGLWALGVRPGDRVALVMANHPEFVTLKVAVARAGAVAVPLNFLYREQELAQVLRQSRCRVLVTMSSHLDLDHAAMLDGAAPGWREGRCAALPELRAAVVLPCDERPVDGPVSVAGLAALGDAHRGATSGLAVDGAAVGDVLFTSGSSGRPRGVVTTHDAMLRNAFASAVTRAFDSGRRIAFALPCYHMFGLVEGLYAALLVGGAVVPRLRFDPGDLLDAVARHRADDLLCVPTMTMALLEEQARAPRDLTTLRAVLSGAAPAPVWVWERVRRELGVEEIVTGYGMTETGGATTMTRPEDPLDAVAATVGRPKAALAAGLPEAGGALAAYRTVHPVTGAELPAGEVGELVCRGTTTMAGYWDDPDTTAAVVSPDGAVRSGDLGRVRPDGALELTGRSSDLYKSGGELVMPREIEDLLVEQEGVAQVHAVGVPDERWGEVGVVWVVREPGSTVTAADVLAVCRARLARFKVPRHVVFTTAAELPVTATGKVRKVELARRAAVGTGGRPLAPSEAWHAAVGWSGSYSLTCSGPLDVAALRTAFAALCAEVPLLGAGLAPGDDGVDFVLPGAAPPFVDAGRSGSPDEELVRPLPPGALSRLTVLGTGSGAVLVLVLHHAVADAATGLAVLQRLCELHTATVTGQPPAGRPGPGLVPDAPEDLLVAHGQDRPAGWDAAAAGARTALRAMTGAIPLERPVSDRVRLTAEQTARVAARARRAGVSVHALVGGSLLVACREELREETGPVRMVCGSPVNLRDRVEPPIPPLGSTNVLSSVETALEVDRDADPESLGKELGAHVEAAIADRAPHRSLLDPAGFVTPASEEPVDVVVSNLGVLPRFPMPPGTVVEDFRGFQTTTLPGLPLFVVSSQSGRLSIDLVTPDGMLPARSRTRITEHGAALLLGPEEDA